MDEIVLGAQENAGKLVFIFHGYGADKNDLRPVGEEFLSALPEAEIHLPNGIEACDEGSGRQWFALGGTDVSHWGGAFSENSAKIMSYVESIMEKKNLEYKDVIFAGFSQGAMMSLSLGLKYGVQAVVAFSGLLLDQEFCVNARNTKVLLTHGAEDTVIPFSTMTLTEEALKNSGIDVKTAVSPNLSHGIDHYLLTKAVDFLKGL
jgi:phospholipase/carboxylesterase